MKACSVTDAMDQYYAIQTMSFCVESLVSCYTKQIDNRALMNKYLPSFFTMVLDLVWSNWENPVHNIFDKYVPLQMLTIPQRMRSIFDNIMALHDVLADDIKTSIDLTKMANFLLHADWSRKGKYPSLVTLLPRIGGAKMLELCPDLCLRICEAMR